MPHLSNMMARYDTAIGMTASDVADAIDICRIELKKGAQIPPNIILLNHRDELVSFCCGGKDDIIDENCVELCTLVEEMKQVGLGLEEIDKCTSIGFDNIEELCYNIQNDA